MRRVYSLCALLFMVAAVTLLVAPSRLRAIVYGFVDTQNVFTNTGAFVVKSSDGRIFPICSGALISPTVFLTASHCTSYFENELVPLGYSAFASFDNPIPFGDLTSGATKLLKAVQVVTNPQFRSNGQRQTDPADIGLLLLQVGDTLGIPPATLPPAGLLDLLAAKNGLKDAVFTAAGYGLQNRVTGGGQPFFQDLNPVPRMYAFSSFNALTVEGERQVKSQKAKGKSQKSCVETVCAGWEAQFVTSRSTFDSCLLTFDFLTCLSSRRLRLVY